MITFYKPNAKVTGAGCSFYVNDQGDFFATFIKQKTASSKGKNAQFAQNNKAVMKLSETEIGGLINTILRKTKTEGYHQSPNQVVKFSLEASTGQYAGSFSWGATFTDAEDSSNSKTFFAPLGADEAMVLVEHLRYMLHKAWEIKDKNYSGGKKQKYQKPQEEPQRVTTDDPLENGDIF